MATKKKPLNKKNLVLLGLLTAVVGTYFLAGLIKEHHIPSMFPQNFLRFPLMLV